MRTSLMILLLFSQFFFGSLCFSQSNKIDSLKKILPGLKDTARIECLHALGVEYCYQRKLDSASYYANLVYEESKKINYIRGIANSYRQKAFISNNLGDYFESEQLAREAIDWFSRTSDK